MRTDTIAAAKSGPETPAPHELARAPALARAGADVAVAYRSRRDEAEDVAQLVRAAGRRPLCLGGDQSDPEEAGALVAEAAERLRPIDVLVDNAGINPSKPITQLTPEDWRQTINVNLSSVFYVTQAALPSMRERRWGRIIILSSVAPSWAASSAH